MARRTKPQVSTKAKDTAVLRNLDSDAKRINGCFDRIDKAEVRADDLRLTASIEIAKVKKKCEDNKIGWKKWAEANLVDTEVHGRSWRNIQVLAQIGVSGDIAVAGKALADMRNKNAKANKKSRNKTTTTATGKPKGNKGPGANEFTRFDTAFDGLGDEETQASQISAKAKSLGMKVVAADEPVKQVEAPATMAKTIRDFKELKPSEQLTVFKKLAKLLGVKADTSALDKAAAAAKKGKKSGGADDGGDQEIPSFLQRRKKGGGAQAAA